MKQLSLNIADDSITETVASSSFDYKIEIIKTIGKSDVCQIIDISKDVDLATQHKIMNVPTFVVIENGVEKSRKIGSTTIDGLRDL